MGDVALNHLVIVFPDGLIPTGEQNTYIGRRNGDSAEQQPIFTLR